MAILTPKILARSSPAGLALAYMRGRYAIPPHIRVLSQKLCDLAAGRIRRLLVQMPPRHGKSMLTSQYFVSWYLGMHPSHRVILTSYEATFAASWGRKVRDILRECGGDYFGVTIRTDTNAADNWEIARYGGGMITAGAGGPVNGMGANLFIIDDPIKNAEQAKSSTYCNAIWDWYTSTAYTRLEPDGKVALVMTRWGEDDLAGRILQNASEPWESISFPAIATEEDCLGRQPGEPLWGERFSLADLRRIEATLPPSWWNALYQQRPYHTGGAVFKRDWLTPVTTIPPITDAYLVVDSAISEKDNADYSVLLLGGETEDHRILLLDLYRARLSPTDLLAAIISRYTAARERFPALSVLIEDTKEARVIQHWLRRDAPQIRVTLISPEGRDKVTRARLIAPYVEGGRVQYLPGPWVNDFLDELVAFSPDMTHRHDDQVDTLVYLVARLYRLGFSPGTRGTVVLGGW